MRRLLPLLIAACAHTKTPDTFVRMERTECLGRCPVYTLTLYLDGAVEYRGVKDVATGTRWTTIAPAQVNRVMAKAEQVPTWTCDPSRVVTDRPGTIITVSRHGQEVRRIDHDGGDPCTPPAMQRLESDIDITAGTARFVNDR